MLPWLAVGNDIEETTVTAAKSGLSLKDAQAHLATQPFDVWVGARLMLFDSDGATLEIDVRPGLLQQNRLLHGGVLSYAADNALTYAAGTVVGVGVLTGGINVESCDRPGE